MSRRPTLIYFWKATANFTDQFQNLRLAYCQGSSEKRENQLLQPLAKCSQCLRRHRRHPIQISTHLESWYRTSSKAKPAMENTGSKGVQESKEPCPGTLNHEPQCWINTAKYVDQYLYIYIYVYIQIYIYTHLYVCNDICILSFLLRTP